MKKGRHTMKKILKGSIKELKNFEQFSLVYKSYSSFPYYEEWKDEDIRKEYEFCLKNGYVFGCFYNEKCVGIITLIPEVFCNNKFGFKNPEKVLYISNLIVLFDYRYHSFGSTLADFAVKFAKEKGFKTIYFRFRESHEFGKRIAQRLGFSVNYDFCEKITRPRTKVYNAGGQYGDTDIRLFMFKQL